MKIYNQQIPQKNDVKYLGVHLDKRLTWKKHIQAKRAQLNLKVKNLAWLLGHHSHVSLNNKLLIYKAIIKPVWTYGIQLWGTASNSNIEILQRFQSKTLRMIANAPWYVTNDTIHKDFQISTIREEIGKSSEKYISRLDNHPNHLAVNLLDTSRYPSRLKRNNPLELTYRFSN